MLYGLLILLLTGVFSVVLIDQLKIKHPIIEAAFLKKLFFYHVLLSIAYYLYVLFNASDSRNYFRKVAYQIKGDEWFNYYGTSTTFIEWLTYPFVHYLGFTYDACMALFAFFGFIGFVYFYIFFKERLRFQHQIAGMSLLTIIFLLPNLHFWSGSLGKGSIIFMGFGLFFYAINKPSQRLISLVLGGLIIYHVRPHIMLVILVSIAISFTFSTKGVSGFVRFMVLASAAVAFFFIYKDVLSLVGIDEEEFVSQGLDLSHRASELSKAGSGIDISNYSIPMLLFTFLYRPLFFDAPGVLGYVVSFENVFYLIITFRLLNFSGIRFLFSSSYVVKTAFFSFLTVSLALAQISGNLGLAMRQKSQIMILLMFVVIMYLDDVKLKQYKAYMARKMRMKKMETAANPPQA